MRHHEETIEGFTASLASTADVLGLVVVGSVARGDERADSDVDVYLVLSDEGYAEAERAGRIAYVSSDGVCYEGGYVDIKLCGPAYLADAVQRADDPTRASFVGARVVLDRLGGLPETARAMTRLPDAVWDRRVHAYRSQVALYGGYFLRQAYERGDAFLLRHSAVHTALAAGRTALARHRQLFRGQKYLSKDLAGITELPGTFRTAWWAVLDDPSPATAQAIITELDAITGGPLGLDETLSTFIADNELAWLHGTIPPEFW
ncbi:nucleotidyltransferase domain-containing protein [Microlunatus ginsengisoli]|uniref:Polymerase nucleotidyl transferase domain-containing protein n=1 Tax=Microlunatus ginsengisoli TaxID=363863 RepID=A0ABP6ZU67_9ACTN